DARERFFDSLEATDRHFELFADTRVGAGAARGHLAGGDAQCRQGNPTPDGKALDQHAPALADIRLAPDQPVKRDKHVAAGVRAVLKRRVQWIMAMAYLHPRRVRRNQRKRNTALDVAAEQAIRVVELESQAEHGSHRPERDVALLPIEPDAEHLG